jgi:hypothetical protein
VTEPGVEAFDPMATIRQLNAEELLRLAAAESDRADR